MEKVIELTVYEMVMEKLHSYQTLNLPCSDALQIQKIGEHIHLFLQEHPEQENPQEYDLRVFDVSHHLHYDYVDENKVLTQQLIYIEAVKVQNQDRLAVKYAESILKQHWGE